MGTYAVLLRLPEHSWIDLCDFEQGSEQVRSEQPGHV